MPTRDVVQMITFRISIDERFQPVVVTLPGAPEEGELIEIDGRAYRVLNVSWSGRRGVLNLKSVPVN